MKNTLTFILLVGLISCSDSEYYKVQFENVDRLTEGDKVILKGLEIGEVKDLQIDDDKKVLATICVRNVKVTKGSTFTIHSELLGKRYVEVNLADEKELMNSDEIQKGFVQLLPDTAGQLRLTGEERDSLVNHLLTPFIKSPNKDTVIDEER